MSEVLTSCAQPSDGMPRRRLNRATARHNGLVNKPSNPQKQPWNAHSMTSVPETQTLARSAPISTPAYRTSSVPLLHVRLRVYQDSRNDLLPLKCHMHFLHFLDFRDDNRVRPAALKHDSAHSHIFAHEGHQLLPLIVIRHFVRNRQIQVAILGQNSKRRTGPHASQHALHAQVSRVSIEVLNGACNVSN